MVIRETCSSLLVNVRNRIYVYIQLLVISKVISHISHSTRTTIKVRNNRQARTEEPCYLFLSGLKIIMIQQQSRGEHIAVWGCQSQACHAGTGGVPPTFKCSSKKITYRTTHFGFFLFFTCKAARVAVSKTSRTPSLVLAEHSK